MCEATCHPFVTKVVSFTEVTHLRKDISVSVIFSMISVPPFMIIGHVCFGFILSSLPEVVYSS